jgi:hypothetical protein
MKCRIIIWIKLRRYLTVAILTRETEKGTPKLLKINKQAPKNPSAN